MIRYILNPLVVSLVLSACTNSGNQSMVEQDENDSTFMLPVEGPVVTKEFSTKSGMSWIVTQSQLGASLVNVKVETHGFSEQDQTIEFSEIDPIIQILLADLDKNGFEEIYFVTQAAGSGSYATIYGLNSNNDKSVSEIYFEGATLYNTKSGDTYEGYMGHDNFELIEESLTNTYPVYREGDSDANPTGGKRKVFYKLVRGGASWQLKPARGEAVK